jgi:UPF0755 protein
MRPKLIIPIVAGIIITIFLSVLLWFYVSLSAPVAHRSADEYIRIEKGTSPSQIVSTLASKGIIRSPLALRLYLRVSGKSGGLKAGDFKFPSPVNSFNVVEILEKGNERSIRVTIPEGWTRFEIAARLAKNFPTDPPTNEKAVLYLMNDTSQIKDFAPDAGNLEGFLYPTTYDFEVGTAPKEAIDRMVAEFRKVWQPDWTIKARNMGRTPYEIVTIASLIENESKFDGERKVVASVIYNRLDRGMALGIDATNVYIAKLLGKWDGTIHKSDIEVNHPYNTRKIAGLPPGPISSASKSAFEAALDPAKTEYLYYVLDVEKNDGSHQFFASAADFERAKAKYQRWLEKQRKQ